MVILVAAILVVLVCAMLSTEEGRDALAPILFFGIVGVVLLVIVGGIGVLWVGLR